MMLSCRFYSASKVGRRSVLNMWLGERDMKRNKTENFVLCSLGALMLPNVLNVVKTALMVTVLLYSLVFIFWLFLELITVFLQCT